MQCSRLLSLVFPRCANNSQLCLIAQMDQPIEDSPLRGNLDTPAAVANVFIPLATRLIESDCRWSEVWSDCSHESKCSLWQCTERAGPTGERGDQQRSAHRDLHKPTCNWTDTLNTQFSGGVIKMQRDRNVHVQQRMRGGVCSCSF